MRRISETVIIAREFRNSYMLKNRFQFSNADGYDANNSSNGTCMMEAVSGCCFYCAVSFVVDSYAEYIGMECTKNISGSTRTAVSVSVFA